MSILEKNGNTIAMVLTTASAIAAGFSIYTAVSQENSAVKELPVAKSASKAQTSAQVSENYYIDESEENSEAAAAEIEKGQIPEQSVPDEPIVVESADVQPAAPVEAVETEAVWQPEASYAEAEPAYTEPAPVYYEEPAQAPVYETYETVTPVETPVVEEAPVVVEEAPVYTEEVPVVEEAPVEVPVVEEAPVETPAEPTPAEITVPEVPVEAAPAEITVPEVPVEAVPEEIVIPEAPAEAAPAPVEEEAPVIVDQVVLDESAAEPVQVIAPAAEEAVPAPVAEDLGYVAPEEVPADTVVDPGYVDPGYVDPGYVDANPYADLNARIAEEALKLVGVTDGMQCTEVVQLAMANAGVSDAQSLWPNEYADMYGSVTDTPQAGNLIYYNQGGNGLDHVAIYVGDGQAVHGNYITNGESHTVIANAELPNCTDYSYIQVER